MENTLEERIRQHAYFLWLDSGAGGDPTYFWLTAEREVLAEVEREAAMDLPNGEASRESAAQRLARRVNALVLLESDTNREEVKAALAAE